MSESRFGRELRDADDLTWPIERVGVERNAVYWTDSGYYTIGSLNRSGPSRTLHAEKPVVQAAFYEIDDDEPRKVITGLLLGTSLSGDGNAIEPALPPSGSEISPVVIELLDEASGDLSLAVLRNI